MNKGNSRHWTAAFGFILGGACLALLPGCVGYVDGPRVEVAAPSVVMEDDYVYYPNYEMYYSSRRHQYAYRDGRNWVMRPAPRGVAVNVLVASPSVSMTFHDAPGNHHADVARQYPKNWAPHGGPGGPGKPGNEHNQHDQRDQRDRQENHGK